MSYEGYNQQSYNPYDAYNEQQSEPYNRPQFPHHTQASQVVVEGIVFVPTGVYQDQWRRPWTTDLNSDNLNQVHDVVGQAYRDYLYKKEQGNVAPDGRYMVDPMTLAGVSSSFIMPAASGEALARVHMNHSLAHQTCRFMLKIAVHRHGAVEPNRYIAIGYTSHNGIKIRHGRDGSKSEDYMMDPQTDLTINQMLEVRETTVNYGYGDQKSMEMVSVNQVLVDTQYEGVDQPKVIRMRPYEVASTLGRMVDPQLQGGSISATDTRVIQNATPEYSDVHNTNPNDYMARILSGLTAGRDEAAQNNHSGILQPYHNASRIMRDASARHDPFFRAIATFTDGITSATFKWRDLIKVDPNAERPEILTINMRDFNRYKNQRGENMAVGTDTEQWHGRDLMTQWAVQLTNILPPLMMDRGIRRLDVFASNIHRESICKVANGVPFVNGVNLVSQMRELDIAFYEQFVRPMSGDGRHHSYDFDVSADLYGEIVINISLNGSVRRPYVLPAYMNSAMAPVLTSQTDTLDHIARQFLDLQKQVAPAVQPLILGANYATPTGKVY